MKKGITIIVAAVAVLAAILGTFSVRNYMKSNKEFVADGYILDTAKEEMVSNNVDQQYYFSQGDKYKEKYGTQILFSDHNGNEANISKEHFIHYSDGSLGSFTKGVLLDVSNLDQSNYAYYSLTKNTILVKNGNSYELSTKGEALTLSEYIWKISDDDYMLISPTVTLQIGDQMVDFPDYAQISYVDNGIVRISHVNGTYQTISAESKLITASGKELNLVGKSFTAGDGSAISLNDLALNDDNYIKVDENTEESVHIPTFNVINGKDGANGTNGTNGTEGKDGKDGEEGSLGQDGAEGSQGQEGMLGEVGSDGIEGEAGALGFDGLDGDDGEDASNANKGSDLAAVSLNIRPVVSMINDSTDTAAGKDYDVNSGNATMTLKLEDPNETASLTTGSTRVYLYDKETMAMVYSENKAAEYGAALESSPSGASLKFTGLDPDKEYVMVVKGGYSVADNYTLTDATFFSKTFKTDALGIEVSPMEVTSDKISFDVKATDSRITEYTVNVYDLDGNDGTKREIAKYTIKSPDNSSGVPGFRVSLDGKTASLDVDTSPAALVSPTEHIVDNGNNPFRENGIESDHKYYVEVDNVLVENQLVKSGDTVVEMHTLKKQPYDKASAAADPDAALVYVPSIQAKLEVNEKNRTMSLSLNELRDVDYGITGYRYELYKKDSDNGDAIAGNNFSGLTPTYVKETTEPITSVFTIPDGDGSEYVGRVVVLFNDNIKDMELCSMGSVPKNLSSTSSNLMVEIIVTNPDLNANPSQTAHHDVITGVIRVTDPGNVKMLKFDAEHPIKLYATTEYNDLEMLSFVPGDIDTTQVPYEIPFSYEGLRKVSVHSLTAYGSIDTDGDGIYTDVEKNTYLTGNRIKTVDTTPLSLVGTKLSAEDAAFAIKVSLMAYTDGDGGDVDDAVSLSYSNYEAKVMDSVSFSLWQVTTTDDGQTVEKEIGLSKATINNKSTASDKKKNSTIQNAYLDRQELVNDSKIKQATYIPEGQATEEVIGGWDLAAADAKAENTYILKPSDFSLNNNDTNLYSGGYFKIVVEDAQDYTTFNSIPFKEGENYYAFDIASRHVQSPTPYKQVTAFTIDNAAAIEGGKQDFADDETVVGFRFRAEYPYTDINTITYHIYELDDTKAGTTQSYKTTDIYPADIAAGKAKEVLTGTKIESNDKHSSKLVYLYFNGYDANDGKVAWTIPGTNTAADVSTVIKRGKRYFITYEVTDIEGHNDMDCHLRSSKYPDCAYEDPADVPFYRSEIIELEKQPPSIERYQVNNASGTAVWAYRFIDPDNAIIKNDDGSIAIKYWTYSSYSNYTKGTIYKNNLYVNAGTSQTWNNVSFNTLGNNYYYVTQIAYKLKETGDIKYHTSIPVKHMNPSTGDPSGISAQGTIASESELAENKVTIGDTTYQKAVINEGGFRYKLTIRGGNELTRYAALQVTVTQCDSTGTAIAGAKSVVYDPVLITNINTTKKSSSDSTLEYYAEAYLDSKPLEDLIINTPGQASYGAVSVKAYFNNKKQGFGTVVDGYASDSTLSYVSNKKLTEYTTTLDGEKLYAINAIDNVAYTNKYKSYRFYDNAKSLINSYSDASNNFVANSLFIPGLGDDSANGLSGFKVLSSGNNASTVAMTQRGLLNSLSVAALSADSQYTISGLKLDKNGVFDSKTNSYLNVEGLQLTKNKLSFNDADKSWIITLNDLMPAVDQIGNTSIGARSASLKMEVVGDTSQINGKIYARLQDENGNNLKVIQESITDENGQLKYYYKLVSGDADYSKANFADNAIPIETTGGQNTITLNIRGLALNTTYKVVYYAYDKNDNIVDLYSIDGGKTGHQYTFKTLSNVTIEVANPDLIINSYADKYMYVRYAVPGDEGSGIDIYYKVDDGPATLAQPLGESYKYYSQDLSKNKPINISANPGAWPYDTSRTITVYAVEKDAGPNAEPLGSKTINYRINEELPNFIATPYQDAKNKLVGIDVTTIDQYREIIDDKFDVYLYQNDVIIASKTNLSSLDINQKVMFELSEVSGKYRADIVAKYNKSNTSNDTDTMTVSTVIEFSEIPSCAGISASATKGQNKVNLTFNGVQNFDDVASIFVTIYKSTDYSNIKSTKITDFTVTNGSIEVPITMSSNFSEGEYSISVQYRDENGTALGNQTGSFKVS